MGKQILFINNDAVGYIYQECLTIYYMEYISGCK